jgi:ankyrin repeat protein
MTTINVQDIDDNNIENVRNSINDNTINNFIFQKFNALMYACYKNKIKIVKLLIKNGANINDKDNTTALIWGITQRSF